LARSLGVTLFIVKASNANGLVEAFDAISQRRVGALLVGSDPFFFTQREQLVALAARHAVPAMYFFREFSVAGGLISYGTRLADGYRQVGIYTGKILNGANPAELPIARQSEQIEMSLNIKTARTLGLAIPPSILGRADEIIE
jgi:putative ABC transport system substrate-binding protein